jgi:hypothetical protein
MDAIFNSTGHPVAWRYRDAIFNDAGKPLALIRNRNVFTVKGRYLGRFEDGFFRDPQGKAVAFHRGATGGPLPPVTEPASLQPKFQELPHDPEFETPPPPPRFRQRDWSQYTWDQFLKGVLKPA